MFLGDRVNIGPFSRLEVHHGATNAAELRIGSDAMIQHGVHIYATGTLTIGDNALFASGVMITDNNHGFSPSDGPFALQPLMHRRTTIGANVWLGENVAVLSGVTIGNDVIVGANAVVAHDLPARCIALGNPARPVKRYDIATRKWVLFSVDGE